MVAQHGGRRVGGEQEEENGVKWQLLALELTV